MEEHEPDKKNSYQVFMEEAPEAAAFEAMLKPFEIACANFMKMPKSARKAYASSYYFGAKTDDGKQKRFATIIERLNRNLNPMESMKTAQCVQRLVRRGEQRTKSRMYHSGG
jgi:hypothetical protein